MSPRWKRSGVLTFGVAILVGSLAACGSGGSADVGTTPEPGGTGGSGAPSTPASSTSTDAPTAPVASSPTFDAGTTMAKVASQGYVTVGVNFTQPPFGVKNLDGKMVGFDIDMARYIAGALGISEDNIHWVEVTPNNREPYLQQGKVDFIAAAYSITTKRQDVVGFAGPYLISSNSFIVQKGNPQNYSIDDSLAGKKLCSAVGSDQIPQMQKAYPDAQIVTFDVQTKCVSAIENGQVDLFGAGIGVLAGDVANAPDKLEILDGSWGSELSSGIGIKKADTSFCEFIDTAVQSAYDSGYYADAWNTTFAPLLKNAPVPQLKLQSCSQTAP